jgi:hypothetical protein
MSDRTYGSRPALYAVVLAAVTAGGLLGDDTPTDGPRIFGPLPIRSIDSISLLFHQAPLDTASTVPCGVFQTGFDLQYGSHENGGRANGFVAVHDEEILRWEFWGRFGLTDSLEFGFSIPLHYASSGFLDSFISDFHGVTGLGPTDQRNQLFFDSAEFRGQRFAGLPEDHMSLGDVPMTLKLAVLEDGADPIGFALRAGIELPTGHTEDRFGSGRIDGGLGILAQKTLGDVTLFGSADASFQDNPTLFERAGVEVKPVTANAALGLEWRLLDWLALVSQLNYGEALLKNGGGTLLARERLLLALGAHVAICEDASLRISLVEDLVTGPVADVAFLVGLTMEL